MIVHVFLLTMTFFIHTPMDDLKAGAVAIPFPTAEVCAAQLAILNASYERHPNPDLVGYALECHPVDVKLDPQNTVGASN
jgi:hypothetical protein